MYERNFACSFSTMNGEVAYIHAKTKGSGMESAEFDPSAREDRELPAGPLRIRGKGKRERISPIGSYAARALSDWLRQRRVSPREAFAWSKPTPRRSPFVIR